jgi:hypothetical protein
VLQCLFDEKWSDRRTQTCCSITCGGCCRYFVSSDRFPNIPRFSDIHICVGLSLVYQVLSSHLAIIFCCSSIRFLLFIFVSLPGFLPSSRFQIIIQLVSILLWCIILLLFKWVQPKQRHNFNVKSIDGIWIYTCFLSCRRLPVDTKHVCKVLIPFLRFKKEDSREINCFLWWLLSWFTLLINESITYLP